MGLTYHNIWICYTFFLKSKLFITTAEIIINPPINTLVGGISLKNSQTHIGANIDSISINKPTITAGVVLEPIVIKIKPKIIRN